MFFMSRNIRPKIFMEITKITQVNSKNKKQLWEGQKRKGFFTPATCCVCFYLGQTTWNLQLSQKLDDHCKYPMGRLIKQSTEKHKNAGHEQKRLKFKQIFLFVCLGLNVNLKYTLRWFESWCRFSSPEILFMDPKVLLHNEIHGGSP